MRRINHRAITPSGRIVGALEASLQLAYQLEGAIQMAPLPAGSPPDAKFIGAPIDFLVFKGMDAQHIEEVIFVEVKSGSARLNHNEHSLKEAIENKRVRWYEYRVPSRVTHSDTASESAL
jgi:Endonuclease related to archaeal Holliday junction resolvase